MIMYAGTTIPYPGTDFKSVPFKNKYPEAA